jgi:hypothetical protein
MIPIFEYCKSLYVTGLSIIGLPISVYEFTDELEDQLTMYEPSLPYRPNDQAALSLQANL